MEDSKSAISDHFPIITSINQRVDGTIKAKDPGTFGKQTGENSPLNLKCSAPFLRHTPSTRDYGPLLRILMLLQNVLSLGSKEEMTGSPFWKDTNIENLINERDKLSTELQKNNTETNRIRFTNLCHEVEEVISSCKRKKWTEFCETLDPQKISQHWKVIKTLNNQSTHQKADIPTNIISSSGRDAATNKETASPASKAL
ncbi:hypothetical protein TNCV_4722571 [Trichonephila clavipes]|uniref:Uncharacterized protein n=1 Tax=Trichonephila clavipes TaxID=2585209 RepID=A0A8X6W735_TRICX|nr:hypothetical protein TNCV_4722571 [Trichonephila clavipes]